MPLRSMTGFWRSMAVPLASGTLGFFSRLLLVLSNSMRMATIQTL